MWWSVNVLWKTSFKMFVMFSPIFVADTKITFIYKFVAPLNPNIRYYWSLKILHMLYQRIRSSYWAILPSIFMMLSLVSMSLCWNPYLLAINKSYFFILNYLYVYLFPYIPKFNFFFFFLHFLFSPILMANLEWISWYNALISIPNWK